MHLFGPRSSGSGGGGGGIEIEWSQGALDPPNMGFPGLGSNYFTYDFEDGVTQYLYATFRVPDSYEAGNQIFLKGYFFTSATTGTVLMETTSYLLRPDTDAAASTTNVHASTQSAVTVNGTANTMTEFSADITDASGEMNGVAVSAGDFIQVRLNRDAGDTAAASAYYIPKAYEVTLT